MAWNLMYDMQADTERTAGPTRDPRWVGRDSAGHEHRADGGAYPTLAWVVDRTEPCDGACGDPDHEWIIGHFECKLCGEHVEPGMLPAGSLVVVDERVTVSYTGMTRDGVHVKGVIPHDDGLDLLRRVSMTTTPAIRDRIIGQYVEHHPETITETRIGW